MKKRASRTTSGSLKQYWAKRQFTETPEPKGKVARRSGALRFVVHKHAASHSHFDLRLEMEGVYKSWAIPKGPSLNPAEQRLAVHVEDHPLEYGKFEWIIPEGNYGAGTVMIWDEGTYESRTFKDRKKGEAALVEGFKNGHITFILHGKKLKGEFALVRLKDRSQNQWLLVKKRDAFASFRNFFEERSVKSDRTMAEISATARLEGAIWESHKTGKKPKKTEAGQKPASSKVQAMPRRIRLMQPLLSMRGPTEGDRVFSPTWNGPRGIAEIEKGKALIYSKAFLPLNRRHRLLVEAFSQWNQSAILEGEIHAGKFFVNDLLYHNGSDLRTLPLKKRLALLNNMDLPGKVSLVPCFEKEEKAIAAAKKLGAQFLLARKKEGLYKEGLCKDVLKYRIGNASAEESRATPPLTNLDKFYWPEEKITKGDVIAYYDSISELILPYLIDRPQSLHRQPEGIKTAGFFHKDMVGYLPRRIQTFNVKSGSSGKATTYLLCQDRWTLLFLANLGCIEINPWLSRVSHLENPDYVVIDLDPDGNDFEEVVHVATEVRKLLDAIGAESFCKTSGSSGLHICVPTAARFNYDTARIFAQKVCEVVLRRTPGLTSMERNPGKRKRKIYLDHLQNRRGQTLAAPYCLRPVPGASVSTPLKWSEVKKGLDPREFHLGSIRKRVQKVGDLWKPMLSASNNLEDCMKRLLCL